MWGWSLVGLLKEKLSSSKGVTMVIFLSVMGWWKMAISHLKHSYINWRVIPCKRKKWFVCMQFFIIFSTFFLLSWFLFRLNRIFQVHDMTWQSIFLLFFFLVLIVCLLRATTPTTDDLPSRNIFSHMRIVLKDWPFGPKLFISFLSTKRVMAQKYFRERGNFGQRAPRHQSRWFQNITILEFCLV